MNSRKINVFNVAVVTLLLIGLLAIIQVNHTDVNSDIFGESTDGNGVLEWTDGYVQPYLSCPNEADLARLKNIRDLVDFHLPRDCHAKIAKILIEGAEEFEAFEQALFHQVMSGHNVRYNMAFPIHRKKWSKFIEKDTEYAALNSVETEISRMKKSVYSGYTNVDYEVTVLEKSYDFIHGKPWRGDILLPLLLGFSYLSWVFWLKGRI